MFDEGAYAGPKGAGSLAELGTWTLEIVTYSVATKGFVILCRRWHVERTFAWLGRTRYGARDFEASIESAEA